VELRPQRRTGQCQRNHYGDYQAGRRWRNAPPDGTRPADSKHEQYQDAGQRGRQRDFLVDEYLPGYQQAEPCAGPGPGRHAGEQPG